MRLKEASTVFADTVKYLLTPVSQVAQGLHRLDNAV